MIWHVQRAVKVDETGMRGPDYLPASAFVGALYKKG